MPKAEADAGGGAVRRDATAPVPDGAAGRRHPRCRSDSDAGVIRR